ncbi:C45 family peptidase [Desulfopila sp. IMCC35008]|uniref:C45 family autoproteolytic acyltransferase/hydolase n=1 Tax=Desulfopila sp. IMCC35008 TaxID=2653858 RepID=UPI0013D4BF66|nr:C45 family peptidase [Desulfopila sp. IMCC35008]
MRPYSFLMTNVILTTLMFSVPLSGNSQAGGKNMLNLVDLKGSYFEIGKGWGKVFEGKMDKVIQVELGVVAGYYGIPMEAVVELSKKYQPIAENYDPDFIEVLKGFASGADIDFDTLFAIRSALELLFFSGQPSGLCTSLAITGTATHDGDTIIGQNIDWHPELPMALLRIEWPTGVKQLSLSMAGIWEYSLSSHSSASPYGVAATLTATPDETLDVPKVPISCIMNKASRQVSLEEAISVFKGEELNIASFLLANGKGVIEGIELGLNSFEILKPEREMLVHANHYVSERYKVKDIFLQFVPDSPLRYERLKELIATDYGKLTPQHVMKYFSDHSNFPKGICAHVDPESDLPPSATLASVIMIPRQKLMYIAVGNPCENDYIRYSLN